jgi:hypothetical protein
MLLPCRKNDRTELRLLKLQRGFEGFEQSSHYSIRVVLTQLKIYGVDC